MFKDLRLNPSTMADKELGPGGEIKSVADEGKRTRQFTTSKLARTRFRGKILKFSGYW
jgi:hypothetical protein